MGMESFFISVISQKMNINNESGLRKVFGNDDEYNCDWVTYLKQQSYSIEVKKEYLIIDSCIELYLDDTENNGKYITLIGCFSCYDYAIEKMQDIINSICKKVSSNPRVYVGGNTNMYNRLTFKDDINKAYTLKYETFKKMFKDSDFIMYSSGFYKYIEERKNPIKKIVNLFKM